MERKPSTTRIRETNRPKTKHELRLFQRACRWVVPVFGFCMHVSFRLDEKSTYLDVTFTRRQMQRNASATRTRELKRPKKTRAAPPFSSAHEKIACRGGHTRCFLHSRQLSPRQAIDKYQHCDLPNQQKRNGVDNFHYENKSVKPSKTKQGGSYCWSFAFTSAFASMRNRHTSM